MTYTLGAGFSTGHLASNHDLDKEYREQLSNVDSEMIEDNVILINNLQQLESGRFENLEDYANRIMQPVIDEYNARQRRQDRQIKGGYLEGYHYQNEHYIQGKKSKPEIWKEAVLSYGGHSNIGGEYFSKDTSPERKKEIYREAVGFYDRSIKEIQKQYPHMHIAYAVVHADEPNGSIHCHVCFNFIAEYKQGLKQRVCWSKGLEQDGVVAFKDKTLAQEMGGFQLTRFYAQVRQEIMNPMLQEMGYTIKQEEHGIVHQGVDRYKLDKDKAQAEAEQIIKSAKERAIKINMTADKLKDVAQTKASDIINQAEQEKATAVNEAALIKQEAQKESKQIIDNANEKAQEALSAAQSAEADKERAIEQKSEIEAVTASLKEAQKEAQEELDQTIEFLGTLTDQCNRKQAQLTQIEEEIETIHNTELNSAELDRVKRTLDSFEKSKRKAGVLFWGEDKVDIPFDTAKKMVIQSAKEEKLEDRQYKVDKKEREVKHREGLLESREQRVSERERAVAAPESELQDRINREVKKALDGQDNIFRNKANQYDKVVSERDRLRSDVEQYHAIAQKLEIAQGVSLQRVIDTVERSRTQDVVNKVLQVCDYLKTGYDYLNNEIRELAHKAKTIGEHIHHRFR